MIIDSHCHLTSETYGGAEGVDAVVATAVAAGVGGMISIGSGYGERSAAEAVEVARRHPGVVWATVGVHPHDARLFDEGTASRLRELAANPEVVAIGEMGLDFYYDNSPREQQREAFRAQLRLAKELSLPVVVHDRDSDGETFEILREEGAFEGADVLYHCFAGDVDDMLKVVGAGGYISIPGVVTYRRSVELRAVARLVPAHRFLVETDAPFLTPEPLRGRRNEPCHVALTVEAVAELRGISTRDSAALATANTRNFFSI